MNTVFPPHTIFPFFWLIAINPLSLLCFIIENPKIPHVIMMFFLSQIALQQFSGSNGNNHFTNVTCLGGKLSLQGLRPALLLQLLTRRQGREEQLVLYLHLVVKH